jgi:hypothetical protein
MRIFFALLLTLVVNPVLQAKTSRRRSTLLRRRVPCTRFPLWPATRPPVTLELRSSHIGFPSAQ